MVVNAEALERIRQALVEAALRAYEDAGIRGLCEEGRFEAAIDAIRSLDLSGLGAEDDQEEIPR